MAATRLLRAAAAVAVAAALESAGGEEATDADSGSGGANVLGRWHDVAVAAGMFVLAAATAGLSWRCRKIMASRGGADAARAVPRAEVLVLGLPLGRELFDTLFSPAVVQDESVCVVCLLPTGLEEPCRRLGCGHAFHSDCIDRWWIQAGDVKLRCPVCRRTQAPCTTEVSI